MPTPNTLDRFCDTLDEEYDLKTLPDCPVLDEEESRERIAQNWQQEGPVLIEAFRQVLTTRWQEVARIENLEREVILLKERCDVLENQSPILVPIESLAPEPYAIIKPFYVVVCLEDEQCIASFFDANLSASGDTQEEAVSNLKDIIIGSFEILTTTNKSKLGPGPAQQRAVLEQFIRNTK